MPGTFRSLRYRNARLFFAGLLVSNVGTWAQLTATAILVDRLTGKATAIGIMTALQFLPMLLLGAFAGAVADRFDRRKMALITQSALAVQAALLAMTDLTGVINIPIIYVLTLAMGVVMAFDNPARRGFVTELVPDEYIANAVSLNTATMTGSRIFGPAIAAVLIGPLGSGWLFALNAVTFVSIIGSLIAIRESELFRAERAPRGGTPVRDALRFIAGSPLLLAVFVLMTVVSTFGFNHNVIFPRMAGQVWGGEQWYGWVLMAQSAGALIGSLLTASRATVSLRWMVATGTVLGVALIMLGLFLAPWQAVLIAVPLGIGGAGFIASVNAITQELCPSNMRGRILALHAVAFLGSYPIGAPITGWIGDHVSLEWGLAYGGVISLVALSGFMWWGLGRRPEERRSDALRTLLGAGTPWAAAPNERP